MANVDVLAVRIVQVIISSNYNALSNSSFKLNNCPKKV